MTTMIDTPQALSAFVERATRSPSIAFDTEFMWESTYHPGLALVQVALAQDDVALIDAPAVGNLGPLGEVLGHPAITKILHDAQQDLTILRRATGVSPRNIFDTRCAAGFVGLTSSVSLSNLLREVIEVSLPKTETRTNWLIRPLSEKQVIYAVDDVRYLPALHDTLLAGVRSRGREEWLRQELAVYDDGGMYEDNNPREQFRRVKGVGKLMPREQAMLRELAAWREEEAGASNTPRQWVISDEILVRLARRKPRQLSQLGSIRGLGEGQARQYGKKLLQAVRQGLNIPAEDWPSHEEHPKDSETLGARVDMALAYMKGKGMAEEIDPALVASRAEITALVREAPNVRPADHRLLQGWRRDFIGEELLKLLQGRLAVRIDPGSGLPAVADGESAQTGIQPGW